MTDYLTLAAEMARFSQQDIPGKAMLMSTPWREIKHKSLTSQTFSLTDDDLEVISESLRVSARAVRDEEKSARWVSDSHREYLLRWAERFEELKERIEKR